VPTCEIGFRNNKKRIREDGEDERREGGTTTPLTTPKKRLDFDYRAYRLHNTS